MPPGTSQHAASVQADRALRPNDCEHREESEDGRHPVREYQRSHQGRPRAGDSADGEREGAPAPSNVETSPRRSRSRNMAISATKKSTATSGAITPKPAGFPCCGGPRSKGNAMRTIASALRSASTRSARPRTRHRLQRRAFEIVTEAPSLPPAGRAYGRAESLTRRVAGCTYDFSEWEA